jgi:hypothetical protein
MSAFHKLAGALFVALTPLLYCQTAIVDLGWLRVSQATEGWYVEKVLMLSDGAKLQPEDIIVSVDGRRIDNLNALSASNELSWIEHGANYVAVLRKGAPLRLQIRPFDPLRIGALSLYRRQDVHHYDRNERIASLQIPDESGRAATIKPGPGITLIHFWSPV